MSQETPRIAIVTGAARGIGAGVAVRLAADGMVVAVLDLDEGNCADTVNEIGTAGGRALAVGADVSKTDQAEAAVGRVAASLPEDVAHTVSFLVSEGAGYVSGQIIYVAGGPLC